MNFAALAKPEAAARGPAKVPARSSRLRVGEPGDAFEREADQVADRVITTGSAKGAWSISRMSIDSPLQRKCDCGGTGDCDSCKKKGTLQRKPQSASQVAETAPASVDRALAGSGRPLDSNVSATMGERFGYDFSRVRVHSDSAAQQSAHDVRAKAYTVGHNVVFGLGQYSPSTEQGQRLIAHELTHVVQQDNKPVGVQRWFSDHLTASPTPEIPAQPVPEEKRYNLELVVPKILLTNARTYASSNLSEPEAINVLYEFRQKLVDIIDEHKSLHRDLRDNREEHSTVGFWADALGGVDLPDYEMWDSPRLTLTQTLYLLMNAKQGKPRGTESPAPLSQSPNRLEQVAALLQKAADEIGRMDIVLMEYKDGTEKGAARGVTICKVSIVVLALPFTPVGSIARTAVYGGAEIAGGLGEALAPFVARTGGALAWGKGLAMSGIATSFLFNFYNEADKQIAAGVDPGDPVSILSSFSNTIYKATLRTTAIPQAEEALTNKSFDNGADLRLSWYERLIYGVTSALAMTGNAEFASGFFGGSVPVPASKPTMPVDPEPMVATDPPEPTTNKPVGDTPGNVVGDPNGLAPTSPGTALGLMARLKSVLRVLKVLEALAKGVGELDDVSSGGMAEQAPLIRDVNGSNAGRSGSVSSARTPTPDLPSSITPDSPSARTTVGPNALPASTRAAGAPRVSTAKPPPFRPSSPIRTTTVPASPLFQLSPVVAASSSRIGVRSNNPAVARRPQAELRARASEILLQVYELYYNDIYKNQPERRRSPIGLFRSWLTIAVLDGVSNGNIKTLVNGHNPKFEKYVRQALNPGEEYVETASFAPEYKKRPGVFRITGKIHAHAEQNVGAEGHVRGLTDMEIATSNDACPLCVSNIKENYPNIKHGNIGKGSR